MHSFPEVISCKIASWIETLYLLPFLHVGHCLPWISAGHVHVVTVSELICASALLCLQYTLFLELFTTFEFYSLYFSLLVYISEPWVGWLWETSNMPFRAEYFRVFHSAHCAVVGYTFMHCLPESSHRTPSWAFEAIANALGFLLQLHYKTLLLKTPHKVIKLVLK